ncbi:tyrosine/DOPA decarboxylase [Spatholobus suberectus]|nr:tyrosine/DOPA decarboxylase [Spatholobus suberectus]
MLRKSNGKVLFAEGKEDFADFLFSFLTIPLGGVVHLMDGCSFMGSVEGLYKSSFDLDEEHWTTKEVKNKLVDPMLAPWQVNRNVGNCTALELVDTISDTGNSKGYANGQAMYMATDDLVVTPISSISVISLLNSMNIPVNDLEEKVVSIGIKKGVRLLQASLTSTSALIIGLGHLFTNVTEGN